MSMEIDRDEFSAPDIALMYDVPYHVVTRFSDKMGISRRVGQYRIINKRDFPQLEAALMATGWIGTTLNYWKRKRLEMKAANNETITPESTGIASSAEHDSGIEGMVADIID